MCHNKKFCFGKKFDNNDDFAWTLDRCRRSQRHFQAVNATQTFKISARTTTFMWHSQCECVAVKRSVVVRSLRSMVLWDTVGTLDTRVVVRSQHPALVQQRTQCVSWLSAQRLSSLFRSAPSEGPATQYLVSLSVQRRSSDSVACIAQRPATDGGPRGGSGDPAPSAGAGPGPVRRLTVCGE